MTVKHSWICTVNVQTTIENSTDGWMTQNNKVEIQIRGETLK